MTSILGFDARSFVSRVRPMTSAVFALSGTAATQTVRTGS